MMIAAESFVIQWMTPVSKDEDKDWFARWGSYELARYDPDVVSELSISDASKTFLTHAGLPRKAYRGVMQFGGIFAKLPRLEDVQPRAGEQHLHEQYRVLGGKAFLYNNQTLYDGYICLRNKTEEQVYFVESTEDYSARLVNSSVSQLGEFFLLLRNNADYALQCHQFFCKVFDNYEQHYEEAKSQILELGEQTIKRLGEVDAAAVEPGGWWDDAILEIKFY